MTQQLEWATNRLDFSGLLTLAIVTVSVTVKYKKKLQMRKRAQFVVFQPELSSVRLNVPLDTA